MARKPRSTAREGFGILNPYGDVWTTDIFPSAEEAREHVVTFWRDTMKEPQGAGGYRIVRVKQRTSFVGEVEGEAP